MPLVPRHGGDDLCRQQGRRSAQSQIPDGARRSGRKPRPLQPVWRLGLARDDHLRARRHGDREAARLHSAKAHGEFARGYHRGPVSRPVGRRRARSRAGGVAASDSGAAHRSCRPQRLRLRHRECGLGQHAQIHRRRQHGPSARRRRERRHGSGEERASHARCRAQPDRSRMGRHLSIFRRARLEIAALREDHVVPGERFAQLRPSLRIVEGAARSRRRARHRALSLEVAECRGRLLHEPRCRR